MPNYANGKVYKICSYNSDDVYYGSTCLKLCQRLAKHVSDWRLFKLNKTYVRRVTSFSILEQGNYYIELVETVSCASKEELHIRERYWIKNNNCVNIHKNLCRTKEDMKQNGAVYRLNNAQKIRDVGKQYRLNNAQKIRDVGKQYRLNNKHKKSETDRQYRALNKDIIKIKKKEYAERNAEKIKAHRSEYILCDCGKYYTRAKRTIHIETVYHKKNVNLVMFSQFLDL